MNYYNENEPYAADWLYNLGSLGYIPTGTVDRRSILDVHDDLSGFTQCHFFAGIGGWSRALELAGWPEDLPVWTGSCPCQPFSKAGKGKGFDDDRHLWPIWFKIIQQHLPPIIFGEQVGSKSGRSWLDAVFDDLEAEGYACGAAILPACSVGAPHLRQRIFWTAVLGLADTDRERRTRKRLRIRGEPRQSVPEAARGGEGGGLGDTDGQQQSTKREIPGGARTKPDRSILSPGVEHANREGSRRDTGTILGTQTESGHTRFEVGHLFDVSKLAGATRGHWSGADWLACRDGKARPVEPGAFPLVDGFPSRVGRVRAYGNAIVPQVAAKFIEAVMGIEV